MFDWRQFLFSSAGLIATGHYIRGAIELLRTQGERIKNIRQITIVSTDRSFTDVHSIESGTEMANKTWALSSFLPSKFFSVSC